jgi:hypothetical protein
MIAAYALCGTVTRAAEAAGIDRRTHTRWMADPEYAAAFADAEEEATERLEAEARRRAEEGTRRLKFHQGVPIMVPAMDAEGKPLLAKGKPVLVPYVEHEYSDTLLIFLLKGKRPTVYRDNWKGELTGEGGGPVEIVLSRPEESNLA